MLDAYIFFGTAFAMLQFGLDAGDRSRRLSGFDFFFAGLVFLLWPLWLVLAMIVSDWEK